jgi:polyhydroxybutyrate depolymerase
MPIRRVLSALAAASLLVAAGCSDADASADADYAEAEADETSTSTTAAEETTTTLDPADPASVPADPSAGCGTEPDVAPVGDERPGDVEQIFTSAGAARIYRLGVPADYDPEVAVPLVVNLHGSGSDANQASIYGDVPRRAAERGIITVAPQSVAGQWELAGEGADGDFIIGLADDLEARYCIDRNREHVVGMSLGAWKAAATACSFDGRFASAALVTVEVFPGDCGPLPVVAFHGTADPVVAYGSGGGTVDSGATPNAGVSGTRDNIARWAENGGCDAEPEVSELGDDVELWAYPGCDDGVDVELYTIDGGGHTWPGSDIIIGPPEWTTDTIDATALALDWFEAHPRRG